MEDVATDNYEVIIVGGGPAGATAAAELGARGRTVFHVDKATFPREKLCGGLVTWKTTKLLERVFDIDSDTLAGTEYINDATGEYEVRFTGSTVKRGESAQPFYFANRRAYDAGLFNAAAQHESVNQLQGVGVTDVDIDSATVSLSNGETIRGEYLIGADGVHSTVRQSLVDENHVALDEWRKNLAIAAEAYLPRSAVDLKTDTILVDLGFVEWGYGWVFPHGDQYAIGVGGLNQKNELSFKTLLEKYLDVLGIEADSGAAGGYPIPFGNYLSDPTGGSTLLVGDAGGFVDAMSGEGIYYGQRTGELAAIAIDRALTEGSDATDKYTRYVSEKVLSELRISKLARVLLWGGPKSVRRPYIHLWGSALHQQWEELVQGTRLYMLLQKRGNPFHLEAP